MDIIRSGKSLRAIFNYSSVLESPLPGGVWNPGRLLQRGETLPAHTRQGNPSLEVNPKQRASRTMHARTPASSPHAPGSSRPLRSALRASRPRQRGSPLSQRQTPWTPPRRLWRGLSSHSPVSAAPPPRSQGPRRIGPAAFQALPLGHGALPAPRTLPLEGVRALSSRRAARRKRGMPGAVVYVGGGVVRHVVPKADDVRGQGLPRGRLERLRLEHAR